MHMQPWVYGRGLNMGKIEQWKLEKKVERQHIIGSYIACPICLKPDGLRTWEGERALICQHCGAKYKKMQKYIKSRDKDKTT